MEPPRLDARHAREETDALQRAAAFLCAHQDEDGAWRDFVMPPGRSDAWVTAYTGRALQRIDDGELAPRLERVTAWLVEHAEADGGWSYRAGHVASDADSTAHVLAFLAASGRGAIEGYSRLLRFQLADGSFCTYDPSPEVGSWGASHACVTPAATHALLDVVAADHVRVRSALDWLADSARDALWQSFWWTTPWYACALALEVLVRGGRAIDRETIRSRLHALGGPRSVFDEAMAVRCHAVLGDEDAVSRGRSRLWAAQLRDGSWPSVPMLRIVRRTYCRPWLEADAGPVVTDDRRLFTTATVVHALVLTGKPAR
jgi:Prenyltransferase and squalene oxidase repeat